MEHLVQFIWPEGWAIRKVHWAVLAVRQHSVPEFSANHGATPAEIRQLVDAIDQLSSALGHYILDASASPEPWQPAPHIPRAVRAALIPPPRMEYYNARRILELSAAGQREELLYACPCEYCGEILEISYGYAADICRKKKLSRYSPPRYCWTCNKERRRVAPLAAPLGEQHDNANVAKAAQPGAQPEKTA